MWRCWPEGQRYAGTIASPTYNPCSRRFVILPVPPQTPQAWLRFRKCAVFCPFQALICAKLHPKRAQFAASKKVMCFVFSHFLASFPLFLISCSSRHSPKAGTLRFPLRPGARLRQCVGNKTTMIGYHSLLDLSSDKLEETRNVYQSRRRAVQGPRSRQRSSRGCRAASRHPEVWAATSVLVGRSADL